MFIETLQSLAWTISVESVRRVKLVSKTYYCAKNIYLFEVLIEGVLLAQFSLYVHKCGLKPYSYQIC